MKNLNSIQKDNLRRHIAGDIVPHISAHSLGSMFTRDCCICSRETLYPLVLGIGPESQIASDVPRLLAEQCVFLCQSCSAELCRTYRIKTLIADLFKYAPPCENPYAN